MKAITGIKMAFAVIGSFIAAALGGADALIYLLICLTFSDIVFGALKGAKKKNFSSSILFWGLINKAIIFMVVALMVRVDIAIGLNGLFRNSFIIWFSLCEGASIIENSASLGLPWPDGILKIMVQVKKGFSINLSKIVQRIIDDYIPKDDSGGAK